MKDKKKQQSPQGKRIKNKGKREYPPLLKYRIHLRTMEDVRRLLSSTVNELRRQEIDPTVAGKIIYASQVLLNVIEQCNLEERIKKLEKEIHVGYG